MKHLDLPDADSENFVYDFLNITIVFFAIKKYV